MAELDADGFMIFDQVKKTVKNRNKKARPDRRKVLAAEMIAAGEKLKDVADILKVSKSTLHRWIKEPAVIELYRSMICGKGYERYARAMQKLDDQIDNSNPWVAQGAARDIANRLHETVTGEASREVVIKVEGMPDLGMPEAATDDATDYIAGGNACVD